ncbi:MAG: site-2 protease family protein [Clostridia bacterium]|nr:site-2 protease family protein [Clostridia bacterium]
MIREIFSNPNALNAFVLLAMGISALLVALPVHEWAHAFVAYKQGDPTAKLSGRMTLAPFSHFDFFGFLCLLFLGFGWARPVPVDERNFKHPTKSQILVSLAGIFANIIVGTIFIIISCALNKFVPDYATSWGIYGYALKAFLTYAISINFVLVFFNILPIYPLDGFRVVESLSRPGNSFVEFMRRYSIIILILLIMFTYVIDLYLTHTAGNVIKGLTVLFDKFFALF